jgi:hypothetical protein
VAGRRAPASPRMESFRQGLRALGFVDGQNVAIELLSSSAAIASGRCRPSAFGM